MRHAAIIVTDALAQNMPRYPCLQLTEIADQVKSGSEIALPLPVHKENQQYEALFGLMWIERDWQGLIPCHSMAILAQPNKAGV